MLFNASPELIIQLQKPKPTNTESLEKNSWTLEHLFKTPGNSSQTLPRNPQCRLHLLFLLHKGVESVTGGLEC